MDYHYKIRPHHGMRIAFFKEKDIVMNLLFAWKK